MYFSLVPSMDAALAWLTFAARLAATSSDASAGLLTLDHPEGTEGEKLGAGQHRTVLPSRPSGKGGNLSPLLCQKNYPAVIFIYWRRCNDHTGHRCSFNHSIT